ncbi:RING finger protein B-like [Strongylocentrotus purpuratus]|uniref:RING-type domain-containing protein n=1 Tax=Strongylocentrotus purpuratus TaxID=7668 RepID=A0A7M7HF86_STRPU|nr:RING finger protein B-like [Strongylocentrotus purpuratus]|eukprot:XP_011670749.1 PREDICTED: RING finger protein B-like [Strongylocentrotus purpuratus]
MQRVDGHRGMQYSALETTLLLRRRRDMLLRLETAAKLTATETKLGSTEAALAAKQRALEDAQAKLERHDKDTPCSICLEKNMDTPSIRNVYLCAMFMLPLQYMYMFSYPTLSGILFFLVEFLWSVFLLKQLYCTGVELRESKHKLVERQSLLPKETETMILLGLRAQIADLKGKLQTECDSHQKTKLELQLSDARLCRTNALVDETRREFTNQLFEIQKSFNKLGVELSEKEIETLKTNRKLSETQKELEKLRTELVNSKDAESRLAEINAELYAINDNITATQKRLADETAAKLTATETKLGTTESALTAKERALEDAQTKLENRETDNSCSICLDSDRDTAMLPCGHASTCYTCSLQLHERDNAKCPVCRQLIDQILKIYL